MTTFKGQGYRLFAGRHLNHMGGRVKVWDEVSGERQKLFDTDPGQEKWLAFLPIFSETSTPTWQKMAGSRASCSTSTTSRRTRTSTRRLADSPGEHARRRIDRRHQQPPVGFLTTRGSSRLQSSGHPRQRELASAPRGGGQGNWLYHCTSPYPPYPNRHTDCPLTACRLWPWMCYTYEAQGFLFWAANLYRGVENEYLASLGPMRPLNPGQRVEVGHPPGDDWLYYRGPDGLRPSVRILAHREGLTDHTLLTMVGAVDPDKADALQNRIVGDVVQKIKDHPPGWNWSRYPEEVNYLKGTHSTDPADYHNACAEMLRTLDEIQ